MKNLFLIISVVASCATYAANEKVIYGEDNRFDVYASNVSKYVTWAQSTAAKVSNSKLDEYNSSQYILDGKTLEDQGVCKSERVSQQPTVARCTGFLVSQNLLVTAGHCMRKQSDCDDVSWVFDYKVDFRDQSEVIVDKENVYKCKKVVAQAYNDSTKEDYAVVELDRKVTDRDFLNFRIKTGKTGPYINDKLVVIGHPSGLPTKIADGAWIRTIKSNYFTANLDTFSGNSGSPVINIYTGEVEGILVRGETDYVFDEDKNCKIVNRVSNTFDTGEGVTRITIVKGLPKNIEPTPTPEPTPSPSPEPVPGKRVSWWNRLLSWFRHIV